MGGRGGSRLQLQCANGAENTGAPFGSGSEGMEALFPLLLLKEVVILMVVDVVIDVKC